MDTNAFNRAYLPLLVDSLRIAETEIETLETYITEDNINEFVDTYATLQSNLRSLRIEIRRVGKALGMRRSQIRELINS